MTAATWLPDVARDAGVTFRTLDGWATRGHDIRPEGGVAHHTASRIPIDRFLAAGRSDLPGPIANWSTHPDGTITIIAAGRANHAGYDHTGNPLRPLGIRHNSQVYGDEMVNRGLDGDWPDVQLESAAAMWAAVCRFHGWPADRIVSHREWAGPRKPDPFGVDMGTFRARIAALITPPASSRPSEEDDMITIDLLAWIDRQYELAKNPDLAGRLWWLQAIAADLDDLERVTWADVYASPMAGAMVAGLFPGLK